MVAPLKTFACQTGVHVVLALHNGKMDVSEYNDGHHMNRKGAIKYTDALVPEMRQLLATECFLKP
jgi:hypothetical protein